MTIITTKSLLATNPDKAPDPKPIIGTPAERRAAYLATGNRKSITFGSKPIDLVKLAAEETFDPKKLRQDIISMELLLKTAIDYPVGAGGVTECAEIMGLHRDVLGRRMRAITSEGAFDVDMGGKNNRKHYTRSKGFDAWAARLRMKIYEAQQDLT